MGPKLRRRAAASHFRVVGQALPLAERRTSNVERRTSNVERRTIGHERTMYAVPAAGANGAIQFKSGATPQVKAGKWSQR
jgi:hypothetical protein